jgi:hypothetical protein
MKNFQKAIAIIALSGMCLAAPAPSDTAAAKKTKHKKAEAAPVCAACEDIKQLKEQITAQQAQIDQLKSAQQSNPAEADAQKAAAAAAAAQQQAAAAAQAAADANAKAVAAQGDVAGLKTEVTTTTQLVQKEEKKVDYLEHPASIAYKGIRITPGGYLELTGVFRTHSTLSDQATPFSAIPLEGFAGGSATATQSADNPRLSEFGITARDSRITLRADADAGTTKLAGYFEMDFFGTTPTANLSQTSSYAPRLRQAWGRAKFANGFTITGGQVWSLITLNRKGTDVDNSNLWIPNIMEAQYSVGYDWGRFGEVRLSQTFGKKVAFALALDNPTVLSSNANNETGAISGIASIGTGLLGNSLVNACSSTLTTTVLCTNTPLYATNLAPDLIVKLAYDDAKIGHYEIKAIGRAFRDRVVPTATAAGFNNNAYGYGYGAGAVIPVIAKKVDVIVQGLYGKGVSRYEDSGQYDVVIRLNADNQMQALKSYSYLGGIETHPAPKVEISAIFGQEHYYQDLYTQTVGADAGLLGGYGNPATNVSGCLYENATQATANFASGTACAPNNKTLWNAKLYGYYDLYKGTKGILRYGIEVDYIERTTWAGVAGTTAHGTPVVAATSAPFQAVGNDKTAFMTMRYIFP